MVNHNSLYLKRQNEEFENSPPRQSPKPRVSYKKDQNESIDNSYDRSVNKSYDSPDRGQPIIDNNLMSSSNNDFSNKINSNTIPTPTESDMYPEAIETVTNEGEIIDTVKSNTNSDEGNFKTIAIILGIVIFALFSLSLVRLKNRGNDKYLLRKRMYNRNKPLPTPNQTTKNGHMNQQIPTIKVQSDMQQNMNNYNNPNVVEYDLQQQQQLSGYDDGRISFLALGDSAIEPRQVTLTLKEDVIKKSKDNLPIPLIHINNKNAPDHESSGYGSHYDNDELDDINLKAVEPLPGTIIPSKKSPQNSFSNHRILQESHGLFRKVTKSVKNVGNRLKPNSLSMTSKTSNEYSILPSPLPSPDEPKE